MTPARQRTAIKAAQFIEDYAAATDGVCPTVREIGFDIGIRSKGSLSKLLIQMERAGMIRRIPYRARAIEVISVRPRAFFRAVNVDGETRLEPMK